MLGFLEHILHALLDLPYLVVSLLVESINGWIMLLAVIVGTILSVLPAFPSIPTLNSGVLSGVAWFLPVAAMVGVLGTFVAMFVLWLGYQVVLRWGKAL